MISKFIPKSEDGGASDSKLAAQSKKVHEIQDLLEELPPKDLNEMAAPWHGPLGLASFQEVWSS